MDRQISPKSLCIDLGTEPAFSLGGGQVDTRALEYRIGGQSIRLQHQTLKVLVALHDQSGQVVTRDELIDRCWNSRIVGDDVINRCVSLLRPVAAQSGRFCIETVPRLGYRLMETPAVERRGLGYWRIGGIVLLLCAIIGIIVRVALPTLPASRQILTVAVMPFAAQPDDGAQRLASEAQDSVVRMLAASGLSVKLAPSRGRTDDAASDLRVAGVISTSPQGAVATFRVEDLHRHAIVLSRRLEADQAHRADLPDRIGANIAAALSWNEPLILLDEQHPSDPAFLSHLLDYSSNSDYDPLAGFEFARRNAPNAPDSIVAQLALALDTGFAINDIPKEQRASAVEAARHAAERARQLAPDFGDVYVPWCLLHSSVLIRDCEDQLRIGLSRDAQASFVLTALSELMDNVGRIESGHSFARASLAQDRYVSFKLGLAILLDEAVGSSNADKVYAEAVRLWPDDRAFFWRRAEGILQRGDFQALNTFEQKVGKDNFPPDYSPVTAIAKALSARSPRALQAACPRSAQGIQAIQCMIASSDLGSLDEAFAFAATLYPPRRGQSPAQENASWLDQPFVQDTAYLTVSATAALRRDPRFLVLANGLGLLDYWRSGRMPDFCTKAHEAVCSRIAGR